MYQARGPQALVNRRRRPCEPRTAGPVPASAVCVCFAVVPEHSLVCLDLPSLRLSRVLRARKAGSAPECPGPRVQLVQPCGGTARAQRGRGVQLAPLEPLPCPRVHFSSTLFHSSGQSLARQLRCPPLLPPLLAPPRCRLRQAFDRARPLTCPCSPGAGCARPLTCPTTLGGCTECRRRRRRCACLGVGACGY